MSDAGIWQYLKNRGTATICWDQQADVPSNLQREQEIVAQLQNKPETVLRFWWGGPPAVVLGRSQSIEQEVMQSACAKHQVALLFRSSGGGAVLQSEGVFNYSLLFPDDGRLSMAAGFALGTSLVLATLRCLGLEGKVQGVSDVTLGNRKISGNAIARRRRTYLIHGTLLADIDLLLLEACLRHPSREPAYRQGRGHGEFITSLAQVGVGQREQLEKAAGQAARYLLKQ